MSSYSRIRQFFDTIPGEGRARGDSSSSNEASSIDTAETSITIPPTSCPDVTTNVMNWEMPHGVDSPYVSACLMLQAACPTVPVPEVINYTTAVVPCNLPAPIGSRRLPPMQTATALISTPCAPATRPLDEVWHQLPPAARLRLARDVARCVASYRTAWPAPTDELSPLAPGPLLRSPKGSAFMASHPRDPDLASLEALPPSAGGRPATPHWRSGLGRLLHAASAAVASPGAPACAAVPLQAGGVHVKPGPLLASVPGMMLLDTSPLDRTGMPALCRDEQLWERVFLPPLMRSGGGSNVVPWKERRRLFEGMPRTGHTGAASPAFVLGCLDLAAGNIKVQLTETTPRTSSPTSGASAWERGSRAGVAANDVESGRKPSSTAAPTSIVDAHLACIAGWDHAAYWPRWFEQAVLALTASTLGTKVTAENGTSATTATAGAAGKRAAEAAWAAALHDAVLRATCASEVDVAEAVYADRWLAAWWDVREAYATRRWGEEAEGSEHEARVRQKNVEKVTKALKKLRSYETYIKNKQE